METEIKQVQKAEIDAFADEQWQINDKKSNFFPRRESFYFGAYSGGELIAYAQTEIRGGIAETRSLIVKDGLQGEGVGTKLLFFVESWAKNEKNARKTVVKTCSAWTKTVDFYKKLGYKTDAMLPNYYYGVDWYYMSKEL